MTWVPEALFRKIITLVPIACVDLLVVNREKSILLVARKNEPAIGQWWFPGGRVHYGETRIDAAKRKLKEECGLAIFKMEEFGTYDLFFPLPEGNNSHAITTVFVMHTTGKNVVIDSQSNAFKWYSFENWSSEVLHPFVKLILDKFNYEQKGIK